MVECNICGFILEDDWCLCPKCGTKANIVAVSGGKSVFFDGVCDSKEKPRDLIDSYDDCILSNEFVFSEQELKEKQINAAFFSNLDDEQIKAILISLKRMLCIAGAGSGKTTVLTKKIEYLVKYKNVNPKNILAITFTRRAANEMKERLSSVLSDATITTFNAFCESYLFKYEHLYYTIPCRVISLKNSMKLLYDCFKQLDINLFDFAKEYYDIKKIRDDDKDKLVFDLFNDILSVIDYVKNEDLEISSILKTQNLDISYDDKKIINVFFGVISLFLQKMEYMGFRDYSDQLLHFYNLIKKDTSLKDLLKQRYKYIFIDEYQDVNAIQVKIINELLTKDSFLFVCGDPRQSIFGFRGSNIEYIQNFSKIYTDSATIVLKNNYRSASDIVELSNESIKEMGITAQVSLKPKSNELFLIECKSDESEAEFVCSHIKRLIHEKINPSEIFVLSRTNNSLDLIEKQLKEKGIPYIKKTNDFGYLSNSLVEEQKKGVILSTVHAIKGLEAEVVFVIGLVNSVFPSRAHDEKVLCLMKDRYNLFCEDEEKRLFYVALTRAKKRLYLTYYTSKSGRKQNLSKFVSKNLQFYLKKDFY